MKKSISAFLLTLLAAASAVALEAPPIFAKLKPKVGAWAEYSFETKKGEKVKTKGVFRMSVVGKKGDALWIEQKLTQQTPKPKKDEANVVMKFLMGKDGVEKAYMKGEDGVMDMSGMMTAGARKKQAAAEKTKMTEAGTETISVPAGKFKATRYTFAEGKATGESWAKAGVGPYGMIKQVQREGKESSTMELLSSGAGAKSEIDEKSAQSPFGAMMGGKADKDDDEASDEKPAKKKTGLGGFFKKALKQQAGLDDD
ncbi:MAG: hypothetical protein A2506_13630 [Elusimicrobia bacterium RIFOXYD12_FULL_66_9]|nr:MAG: hypothetical protein A2506_13630 [Elusimicrobia bacterium RIFOXYD12_FULL_66_9]